MDSREAYRALSQIYHRFYDDLMYGKLERYERNSHCREISTCACLFRIWATDRPLILGIRFGKNNDILSLYDDSESFLLEIGQIYGLGRRPQYVRVDGTSSDDGDALLFELKLLYCSA